MLSRVIVLAAASTLFWSAAQPSSASPCPYEDTTPLLVGEERATQSMYCLINQARRRAKRRPLTANRQLAGEARTFAAQMVDQQFFSHIDPDGNGLVERSQKSGYLTGYDIWALGENIAWGSGFLGSPRQIMSALMSSPRHRRNILNLRYRNMGVGVSTGIPIGGRFGATYVQQFGWRSR